MTALVDAASTHFMTLITSSSYTLPLWKKTRILRLDTCVVSGFMQRRQHGLHGVR